MGKLATTQGDGHRQPIGIVCVGDFDSSWYNLLEGHSYSAAPRFRR
jgi:hypothetical protein